MPRMLIIGYGNPLRGDDGVGWYAAQQLAHCIQDAAVDIRACHQLTPDLAAPISQVERVIFIDAACGGDRETGRQGATEMVQETPIRAASPLSPTAPPAAFSHHLSPSALLACAQLLYGACPEAILLTVEGCSFNYVETLSEPVRSCLPVLFARVQELIA